MYKRALDIVWKVNNVDCAPFPHLHNSSSAPQVQLQLIKMATTTRRAYVAIRNNTDKPIYGVGLVHKYSNVHKQEMTWDVVHPGQITSATLAVDYNTGFFTTGRDWWKLIWFDEGLNNLYFSDPTNFRFIFDGFDNIIGDAAGAAAGIFAAVVASATVLGTVAAASAAAAASKAITSNLFNSESTEGFKQHILESEDEGMRYQTPQRARMRAQAGSC